MRYAIKIGCWMTAVCSMAVIVIILHVQTAFIHEWIIIPDQGVHADAAMVLGASIYQDGTPSDALRDRLMVGVALYKQGIVTRILLTGDDGSYHADEIDVMKRFTIDQGIPEQDILTDGHGYRTYESCKRAKEEYHLNDILVVTQRFHMARALFLCNNLGVHARGVASDLQTYIKINFFWIRDLAASIQAWWDIHIHQPESPVPPGLYAQT